MITEGSLEYNTLFILYIITIVINTAIFIFLAIRIKKKHKAGNRLRLDYPMSLLIFILLLIVAGIITLYMDFYVNKFDESIYHTMPNILFWRLTISFTCIGLSFLIYTIDKKALNFKLKGIPAYLEFGLAIIIIVFPVNNESGFKTLESFGFISTILALIIPIFFIYLTILAPKNSPLKKLTLSSTVGFIVYGIGSGFLNTFFLNIATTLFGQIGFILLRIVAMVLEAFGLILLAYSSTKLSFV